MTKSVKTILALFFIFGMGISAAYYIRTNLNAIGEIKAPVHVNIEIDKNYAPFVSLMVKLNQGDTLFRPLPTTVYHENLKNIVLYADVKPVEIDYYPFIHAVSLRAPREKAIEVVSAIDGISIFIGNKLFYFSHIDVSTLNGREDDGYILYYLPGLQYEKSLLGKWINWYGDFNLIIKAGMSFFIYPVNFLLVWFFLFCLLFLYRNAIKNICHSLYEQNGRLLEIAVLIFIVLAGFLLRFNGYLRYSAWNDELYSAAIAANPNLPFLNTIGDPGNPPFYFILLRLWLKIFGSSEQSGRFLSVILGTAAIVSIYVLVKCFCGKKAALLAALFMTANNYLIGYSQEMRAYIFEIFLVPVIAWQFLLFMDKKQFENLFWYTVLCILMANTHYYGVLMIMANFLFFVYILIRYKNITVKEIVAFILGNIIIFVSVLPFFIHIALKKALLDSSFNSGIPKPGMIFILLLVIIPFFLVLYSRLSEKIFQKRFSESWHSLFDYAIFSTCIIFGLAVIISLVRPILYIKYLVICFPFLFIVISAVLVSFFNHVNSYTAKVVFAIFLYLSMLAGYCVKPGGGIDVYQESHAYIVRDAESHSGSKSAEWFNPDMIELYRDRYDHYAALYGYDTLYFYLAVNAG
ncbi:MAG: glycosyltransferase family 39 protein, partial [Treponema sp.]|nr:glycosyltransferase family 39 protein [Treponema sp.]